MIAKKCTILNSNYIYLVHNNMLVIQSEMLNINYLLKYTIPTPGSYVLTFFWLCNCVLKFDQFILS